MELKNDLAITGTLHSVDQYLSVKLSNIRVANEAKYPHMVRGERGADLDHWPRLLLTSCCCAFCCCRCQCGTASFAAPWFATFG